MSLIKNSVYNLAGFAIPTLIAVPALGILARQIGVENFGLFTLAFALIGYASIFDAGISRAVIREIAIFRDDISEQNKILYTASFVVLVLGIIAAFVFVIFINKIITALNISPDHVNDANASFTLIAIVIPIYLINQIWLGYLEGLEKFANINFQRIITSTTLALLPTLLCYIHASLMYAVIGLVIGRLVSLMLTVVICRETLIASLGCYSTVTLKRLLSFGSWLTISNIISPIMVYFDRFIISHMMGASRIAYYTAPAEGVARLINIPYALARALFPKLSYCQESTQRKKLELQSYFIISIVCLPIVIIGYSFSSFIMSKWMGPAYAYEAATVLKILLIGFYFNALGQIPYSLLQSMGKSRATAFVHMAEIIPYIFLLYTLTNKYGIIGTSLAWSIRTFCDVIILYILSRKK